MNEFLIRRVWKRGGFCARLVWTLTLPLSFLYCGGVLVRNLLYARRWLPRRSLPVPVVSVGNLVVGGTGKTPTTLWLARELAKRGHKVAVLSRGYKGVRNGPAVLQPAFAMDLVAKNGACLEAGDEPAMMAGLFNVRVGVGRNRYQTGSLLLRKNEADVFLLDDGFQHRQLNRDLDLVLLGSDWEGWLLPAGPFREPRRSLRRAQYFLITGARKKWASYLGHFSQETVFIGALEPRCLLSLDGNQWKESPLSILDRSKILAVSAIANPRRFYRLIHDWGGEIVRAIEFPDHYTYSVKDWQRINRAGRDVDFIVTTEKDIVKLVQFPFARDKLLVLRVEMVIENGDLLIRAIEDAIQKKAPRA
ncbi:MAG: tetraacyldisaccharide 4'-kinase [Deltaproteobacteria bacterium]|nr:tetraacyldisaccharide 4'-kinase [Deltaproteobacteria bacterium]